MINQSPASSNQELLRIDSISISNGIDESNGKIRSFSIFQYFLPDGFNLTTPRMVLAEVLGTFMLVFSVCGIMGSTAAEGGGLELLPYAVTAGSAVVVVVYTVGSISGAHINPAFTFGFAVFGHFSWSKVPFYIGGQVVGSILATYVGKLVYGVEPEKMLTLPFHGCSAAFWAEFIATFLLTFCATSLGRDAKSVSQVTGLVMGVAITLAVLITGPISGGSMNPARTLGPAIMAWKFKHIWIYLLAPTAGSVLGVLMVHLLCVKIENDDPSSPNTSSSTTNSPTSNLFNPT